MSSGGAAATTQAPAAAPPELIPVKFGGGAGAGGSTVAALLNRKNTWAEEGLRVDYTEFSASPVWTTALIAGQLDFASIGGDTTVRLALQGSGVKIIGVYQNRFEYHLLSTPEIASIQDLRGRAVGSGRLGSSSDFATRVLLRHNGLEPERDVSVVLGGGTMDRVAALQSGAVQATVLGSEALPLMLREGYVELFDMSKTDIQYPFLTIATHRALLEGQPGVAERFLRAIYRGIQIFREDPATTQQAFTEVTGETDPDALQAVWQAYRNALSTDLTPTPQVFALLLEEMAKTNPEIGTVAPVQYLETGPIERVNASGFPKTLFGGP
jgi:NitT/TauT family transport system substrate-binding protein